VHQHEIEARRIRTGLIDMHRSRAERLLGTDQRREQAEPPALAALAERDEIIERETGVEHASRSEYDPQDGVQARLDPRCGRTAQTLRIDRHGVSPRALVKRIIDLWRQAHNRRRQWPALASAPARI